MAGFPVLARLPRARNADCLFPEVIVIYNPHTIPIGQSEEKHKARDENRQE